MAEDEYESDPKGEVEPLTDDIGQSERADPSSGLRFGVP
jgi:hypothetical protein